MSFRVTGIVFEPFARFVLAAQSSGDATNLIAAGPESRNTKHRSGGAVKKTSVTDQRIATEESLQSGAGEGSQPTDRQIAQIPG